jgi:hypothetical protein
MRPGVDFRIYGRIRGLSPDVAVKLAAEAPFETARAEAGGIEIEHEGRFVDVEEFLARAVSLLPEGGDGDVDVIDEEAWTITRYALRPRGFEAVSHGLDDILDHTKGEGNF